MGNGSLWQGLCGVGEAVSSDGWSCAAAGAAAPSCCLLRPGAAQQRRLCCAALRHALRHTRHALPSRWRQACTPPWPLEAAKVTS